ncbi:hypothetical protein [Salinimicrobium sp. WS361]
MKQHNVTPAGGNVSHEDNMRMMKRYIREQKAMKEPAPEKLKKAV